MHEEPARQAETESDEDEDKDQGDGDGDEQDFQQALVAIARQEHEGKQSAERVVRREKEKNRFTRYLIPTKRKPLAWPQPCPYYHDHQKDHNNEYCKKEFYTPRALQKHFETSHDLKDLWNGKYTSRYYIIKK